MWNDRETTLQIPFFSQVYLAFAIFWPSIFPSNSNAYHISCNEMPTFNFVVLQHKLLIRNLIVGEFWNRKLILAYDAVKSTGKQIKGNKGFWDWPHTFASILYHVLRKFTNLPSIFLFPCSFKGIQPREHHTIQEREHQHLYQPPPSQNRKYITPGNFL